MRAFSSPTSRPDIHSLDLEAGYSPMTSGSVTVVGVTSPSHSVAFSSADVVRSIRNDLSVLGTAFFLSALSPFSSGFLLPQDPMQSRATWSTATRRRRVISLAAARAIAVSSMEYAERVRDAAAAEEARRSAIWELPS